MPTLSKASEKQSPSPSSRYQFLRQTLRNTSAHGSMENARIPDFHPISWDCPPTPEGGGIPALHRQYRALRFQGLTPGPLIPYIGPVFGLWR